MNVKLLLSLFTNEIDLCQLKYAVLINRILPYLHPPSDSRIMNLPEGDTFEARIATPHGHQIVKG